MHQKGAISSVFAIVVVLLIAAGVGGYVYIQSQMPQQYYDEIVLTPVSPPQVTGCTEEAKQCPDGSSVGRTGPKCEFAACPTNVYPAWIQKLIAEQESDQVANPPASLTRCEYKNQTIYYLPSRCCDIGSVLYGESGDFICSPDGGFTGGGDGKCLDFYQTKQNCTVIWKDSRSNS